MRGVDFIVGAYLTVLAVFLGSALLADPPKAEGAQIVVILFIASMVWAGYALLFRTGEPKR